MAAAAPTPTAAPTPAPAAIAGAQADAASKPPTLRATLDPKGSYPREIHALFDTIAHALPVVPQVDVLSTITAMALEIDPKSLTDHFLNLIPPDKLEADRSHRNCAECRNAHRLQTPDGQIAVPATPARDLLCLADLHFRLQRDEPLGWRFFDMLPGIDIIELDPLDLKNQVLCYDILFSHEEWYDPLMAYTWFERNPAVQVRDFLKGHGYVQTEQPRSGQIVLFVHGNEAVHYARVESVGPSGELTLISKFGNGHVYRHKLDRLLNCYGPGYMLFDPPPGFHPLYTSPKTIRAGAK